MAIPQLQESSGRLALLMAMLLFGIATANQAVHAQVTRNWNNPDGGAYGSLGNWNPSPFPGPLDTARFGVTTPEVIDINFLQSRTAARLVVSTTDINFTARGFVDSDRTYTVADAVVFGAADLSLARTTSDFDLNLEVTNLLKVHGDLSVRDSALLASTTAVVDSSFGTDPTALVTISGTSPSGESSRWESSELIIGDDHNGRVVVENGASASTSGARLGVSEDSFGSLLVNGVGADGSPSSWTTAGQIMIGDMGDGRLDIIDGAFASSDSATIGSSGEVLVRGTDVAGNRSRWNTGRITVSRGRLEIENGAIVTSIDPKITRLGTVDVRRTDAAGNPSTWSTSGLLTFGSTEVADLRVSQGAQVLSETTQISPVANSSSSILALSASADPSTPTRWTNSGDLSLGGSQTEAGGAAHLFLFGDGGFLQVDIGGVFKIWGDGEFRMSAGVLTADRIENTDGGEFEINGGLLQTNRFNGDLDNLAGTLAPGPAASSTLITGDYTQRVDATLAIDIGGLTAGSTHDSVTVSGDALLDGDLALSLINGFTPDVSDLLTVFLAGDLAGFFDNITTGERLDTVDGRGSFVVNYGVGSAFDEDRVILSDFISNTTLPGDFDFDGDVDGFDFLKWQRGGSPDPLSATDLTAWETNYGAGQSLSTSVATNRAVPEPATMGLLFLAAAITVCQRRRWVVLVALLGCGVGLTNQSAHAQVLRAWNNPNGGIYGSLGNWNPSPFPGSLDTAIFDLFTPNDVEINFLQSHIAAELQVIDGDIVFTSRGSVGNTDRTYTVDDAKIGNSGHLRLQRTTAQRDLNLVVNDLLHVQSNGQLSVLDSAQLTSSRAVVDGIFPGRTATATVSGHDQSGVSSTWNTTDLVVGQSTGGSMNILNGGRLDSESVILASAADSVGQILVSGAGTNGTPSALSAINIAIGSRGMGTLIVESGGAVSTGLTVLSFTGNGDGELIVRGVGPDGSPSTWSATSQVDIGTSGSGTLRVEDGAVVSTMQGTRLGGAQGNGVAVVAGVDGVGNPSRWTADTLTVSHGALIVRDGGVLESGQARLGTVSGSSALIRVGNNEEAHDTATWNVNGALTLGDGGGVSFVVEGGASLSSGTTLIGKRVGERATLVLGNFGEAAQSSWISSGDVFVGGDQLEEGGDGVLSLSNNSRVDIAGTVKIWGTGRVTLSPQTTLTADSIVNTDGGEFQFDAGVLQTNRFEGNLLNLGGTLAPGPDAGSTVVIGDYTQQPDATLAIDIGGTTAGVTNDLVNLTGTALLDGQLDLSLINGFSPGAADVFTILSAGSLFDSFDNVLNGQRLETTDGLGSFVVNYGVGSAFDEDRIILSDFLADATLPGDFDFDGDVDGFDFLSWQRGGSPDPLSATDLTAWETNYGNSSNPLTSSARAIPEPATLGLMLFATAITICQRRRNVVASQSFAS